MLRSDLCLSLSVCLSFLFSRKGGTWGFANVLPPSCIAILYRTEVSLKVRTQTLVLVGGFMLVILPEGTLGLCDLWSLLPTLSLHLRSFLGLLWAKTIECMFDVFSKTSRPMWLHCLDFPCEESQAWGGFSRPPPNPHEESWMFPIICVMQTSAR